MSWRYSTGLRNAKLEQTAWVPHAVAPALTTFTVAGGANGGSTIESATDLSGFISKAYITIINSLGQDGTRKINSEIGGVIEVGVGDFTSEIDTAGVILATAEGGSYRGIFRNMTIDIRTGAQPASADDAETGSLLCRLTLASGVFVPGSPDNGLNFGQVANAALKKELDAGSVAEVWSGVNVASGTAGYFRIYDNAAVQGASTSAIRLDGSCATSGAQMNLTNTALVNGVTTTIDQVALTLPAS